jgi:hypothetical protein
VARWVESELISASGASRQQRTLIFVMCAATLAFSVAAVQAQVVGAWTSTTAYPTYVAQHRCVVYSGFVYCVGGFASDRTGGFAFETSAAYYAAISPSGIASWTPTTAYPSVIANHNCVVSLGFIYCVGGAIGSAGFTGSTYYAQLSASGIGSWIPSTSYPAIIQFHSCVADLGFIYCIGGDRGSSNAASTVRTYYATLSSSGIGAWKSTTDYPSAISEHSCVEDRDYIFCVGGIARSGATWGLSAAAYFAPLSSSGIGNWIPTTDYPTGIQDQNCVVNSGRVYCIGGVVISAAEYVETNYVYDAPLTPSGIGAWEKTASYPMIVNVQSCVVDSGDIFCIGGSAGPSAISNNAYFGSTLSSAGSSAQTTHTTRTQRETEFASASNMSVPLGITLGLLVSIPIAIFRFRKQR